MASHICLVEYADNSFNGEISVCCQPAVGPTEMCAFHLRSEVGGLEKRLPGMRKELADKEAWLCIAQEALEAHDWGKRRR